MQLQRNTVSTHPQRAKITEQLLAGIPLRNIAAWTNPKLSHSALQRYKTQVVIPSIRQVNVEARHTGDQQINVQRVQDLVTATPVRERLEYLWGKTNAFVEQSNVTNAAPLLNAARSQIELLAKLSGELREHSGGPNISISITTQPTERPRIDLSEDGCDELGLDK